MSINRKKKTMDSLKKKGKEKLRFKIMNEAVSNRDFKYFNRLFLTCLNENPDIAEELNRIYEPIQIYYYYETKDPNIGDNLRKILNDPEANYFSRPIPALAQSRKNVGCILVFLKHMWEFTQKRADISNIENYHKNGVFEELCHLVEHNGDSSIHPQSYEILWKRYVDKNFLTYGNEIIARLDADRNHYEVYSMMLKAYPNDWVERYSKYFSVQTPEEFNERYEQSKRTIPINIVFARLLTDFLRSIDVLYVAKNTKKEKLLEKK